MLPAIGILDGFKMSNFLDILGLYVDYGMDDRINLISASRLFKGGATKEFTNWLKPLLVLRFRQKKLDRN